MVLVELCVKADLENVASIELPLPNHTWYLDVKQSNGDEVRHNCSISQAEEFEMTNSRGHANFLVKFEGSHHQSSINIVQDKRIHAYTAEDSGKFVPFVMFECRGAEPCAWHPRDGYTVKSTGGTTFNDVDLDDKDWTDYCEKSNESVGIYNLEWTFKAVK
eukprot:GHVN01063511.1.p1 GENE.GHVN01063511.1~~GHVN01063511.1.p1  ORF type:complete len:161 (-),score=17.71 GHVN01063511.1:52-534(-)